MVKPDVIVVNPASIDYPLWRWEMRENRDRFGKIIVGFYNDYRKDNYKDFIIQAMQKDNIIAIDAGDIPGNKDWRDVTVNMCLEHVESDWVLFLEQDFVPKTGFWDATLDYATLGDLVGYGDMGIWSADIRLHPAFIMVKTELINKTRKDFGAHPDRNRDHFATFTEDLYKIYKTNTVSFSNIGHLENLTWEHRKGLYSNYMRVLAGEEPNYEPDKFREYVKMAMEAPVEQDPRFLEWSKRCLISTF